MPCSGLVGAIYPVRMPTSAEPPITLADRYRLVRRLAGGGMGTVHEAVDERLGRRVAVKILNVQYSDDPLFVERFGREARAAASLGHPNIAQVFDSGQDDGQHFMVMELVEGGHLGQVLREHGPLAPERAADVAAQVCSALAAAHEAGIVHRDIKPGNVLVRPDGRVKVTDFGIAHTQGQSTLTGTGSVLGTVQYLSPEQASGQPVTPASDLYSVGVLLFEMLTGSVPFTGDSPVAVALSHVRDEVPAVRDLAPEVPPALAAVVARATAKDPLQRHADARQMEAALRNALTAPPAEPSTSVLSAAGTGKKPGGLPRARLLGATGLLLVTALAAGWMTLTAGPSSPEADAGATPAQHHPRAGKTSTAPSSPSTRTSSPPASPARQAQGPVVPADAVGTDAKALEDLLRSQGYDVQKVDVPATAPKDSTVATIPGPGQPLAAQQTVVLVTSQGKPPKESSGYVVPDDLVGSDAKDAEQLLKDHGLDVKKVVVDSTRPKDVVVASSPGPGSTADAGTVVLAVSKGQ